MELRHAKKVFITTKRSEDVTARALETYGSGLKRFFDYLLEQNIFDVVEVNAALVREFLVMLKEKGLRGITVHQFYRLLRTFFTFIHQENYISKNSITNVSHLRLNKRKCGHSPPRRLVSC